MAGNERTCLGAAAVLHLFRDRAGKEGVTVLIRDVIGTGGSVIAYSARISENGTGTGGILKEFYPVGAADPGGRYRLLRKALGELVFDSGDRDRFEIECGDFLSAYAALEQSMESDPEAEKLKEYLPPSDILYGGTGRENTVYVWNAGLQGVTLEGYLRNFRLTSGENADSRLCAVIETDLSLLRGLSALACCGYTHNDVKPSNLLVPADPAGKTGGRVLFIDIDSFRRNGEGCRCGTAGFAAPELRRGHSDLRSDIYSFGCLLYHQLVFRSHFLGEVYTAGSYGSLERRFRESLLYSCSAGLKKNEIYRKLLLVLKRCLARNPAGRYQNYAELIRELEETEEGIRAVREAADWTAGKHAAE